MKKASMSLNSKEESVLDSFPKDGSKISISDLAAEAFAKKGTGSKTKGNSYVRNSLRKLVRMGLVKQAGKHKSGFYCRTDKKLSDLKIAA